MHDVVEDVVPHFVSEDEERFRSRHLLHGGVPYNHSFGSAKAGDIGVQGCDFFTGLHLIHAVSGNRQAATLHDFLNRIDKLRMAGIERTEFVEKRIDHDRREKNNKN